MNTDRSSPNFGKPSNQPLQLLAKSRRNGRELTLDQHLRDTEDAASRIFRIDGRWGRNWCRFFQISNSDDRERFLLNLRVAALFHDIGKANEDFMQAVTGSAAVQTMRHEHLSALLLCLPEVRQWLSANERIDVDVVTAAVLSHHLKASDQNSDNHKERGWQWGHPRGIKHSVRLYLNHPEIESILARVAAIAGLGEYPRLKMTRWAPDEPWAQTAWRSGSKAARDFNRQCRKKDTPRLALQLAVKAGLIVADSVASGIFRQDLSLDKWIDEVVHSAPITGREVSTAILEPRAAQISRRRGLPFTLHPFQERAGSEGARTLLLAACAAGKTLAAWKWAESMADQHEIGRVIFLYPTRGTATEGFRDYVGWAPEAESAYVAGDSRFMLADMATNPSEATSGKNFDPLTEDQERLFALGLWPRRYFSATVDQFLGFIEHSYTGLCLLPVLADSVVIIDEVHSFDPRMFDRLIAFLKHFALPVLCMTATLSPGRIRQLEDAGLKLYRASEDKELEKVEQHPRYRLEPVDGVDSAMIRAIEAWRAGQRILWVVNRVSECQRVAALLEIALGSAILTYHSRFRLMDRKGIHAETVTLFQQRNHPAIAVTTQVCEMSLDLDADLLITELAPISSLVQRFGRANRKLDGKPAEFRARLLTYQPASEKPYQRDDLVAATGFLADLGTGDVSQRQLAEALDRHAIREPPANGNARFLESGYFAIRGEFRDIDDFAAPCLLTTDLDRVKQEFYDRNQPLDGFVVNVPKSYRLRTPDVTRPEWLPRHLELANGNLYCSRRGFMTE